MVTVSTRREPGSKLVLEIDVPATDVDRYLADAYRVVAQRNRVPGFRPGKAPRSVIDRYVGRGPVVAEAIDHLVQHSYEAALEQVDAVPIDQPDVDVDVASLREGEPLRFSATVAIRPDVDLGAYTDYPFRLEVPEVTDAQVDAVIEELRDEQGSLHPVEARAARDGDYATLRMSATVDGEPVPGASSDRLPVVMGRGSYIPGFEEQLVGLQTGETKAFDLTFPDDYGEEGLRGRQARFEVELLDLREKRLPELDDEFARSVSNAQTVAELRSEVRAALERQTAAEARHAFSDRVIEFATANATVEIPEVLIANEVELMRDELRSRLARQRIGYEQYLELARQTSDELLKELRETATRRVKTLLVLSAIAEKEGIDLSQQEVDAEIAEQLARYPDEPRVAEYLQSARDRAYLRMTLRNRKLVDTLVERAIGPEPGPDDAQSDADTRTD
ncbi:MAG: trigger factor, partial [Chloroflexota bacterium]|nr:trigger factor [Chloroflexota bacterium]